MELKHVVPWGRSFQEYVNMFCLTPSDLQKRILGCGDGPAAFNSELNGMGGKVVSVDPVYAFSCEQLKSRISLTYDEIMPKMVATQDQYIWESIASVEALGQIRLSAMNAFLRDYESGKREERYIEAALPNLPFENAQFELALCSHYLFLYSDQVDFHRHLQSFIELVRVADEVRVYPLVTLKGELSPYLEKIMVALMEKGHQCELVDSHYQFQKKADQMLVIHSIN